MGHLQHISLRRPLEVVVMVVVVHYCSSAGNPEQYFGAGEVIDWMVQSEFYTTCKPRRCHSRKGVQTANTCLYILHRLHTTPDLTGTLATARTTPYETLPRPHIACKGLCSSMSSQKSCAKGTGRRVLRVSCSMV